VPSDTTPPAWRLLELTAGLLVGAITCLVSLQVFARYVLNDTPPWSEELCRYLFVWASFLGACVAMRRAAHLGVDSLVVRLPPGVRSVLHHAVTALVAVFAAMSDVAPLSFGFTHPMSERVYEYPRVHPQVTHMRLETTAVIDFVDPLGAAPDAAALAAAARRVIVLEDLVDHANVGAIFRCAAALGVDAVFLSPRCADPLYRRAVKVSMGAVFAIPYARMSGWYDGLAGLRAAGFRLLALTPDRAAAPIGAAVAGQRTALLLGSEGDGLSSRWLREADQAVRIPMHPGALAAGVDSLNVVAAAAIACRHGDAVMPNGAAIAASAGRARRQSTRAAGIRGLRIGAAWKCVP